MKNPTITAFAHTKGGAGKSTLAWHTAMMLQAKGEDVLVIDLDFQQTIYFLNMIRSKKHKTIEVSQPKSVSVLRSVIAMSKCPNIIIDIGGFDNDINRAAIKLADRVIVPVSNSVTEVLGFRTFEGILGKIGVKEIDVVLNSIHPLTRNFDEISKAVNRQDGYGLLPTVVRRRVIYSETMGSGRSVFDLKSEKAEEAQKEIEGVWYGYRRDR